ncbi:MAG: YggT family protein [Acidimicrobiales bacterium]|nr:YggT family protein [Hyphomonadaceae bacterium]RZV42453.1 MAG: YggT family protein [Acidimicrobiales bacterium]
MGIALAELLINIINLYIFIIFAWVIASWLVSFGVINIRNPTARSIVSALERLVQPAVRPIQKIIPPMGGLDLSPIVLLFGLYFIQSWIVQIANGNFL